MIIPMELPKAEMRSKLRELQSQLEFALGHPDIKIGELTTLQATCEEAARRIVGLRALMSAEYEF